MPPGRQPKPAHLRQRRNKASTKATLPSEAQMADAEVPELLDRPGGWHPAVLDWWADVWRSPQAAEYLKLDRYGLYRLAMLWHDWFNAKTPSELTKLSQEMRQLEQNHGLSPVDRRRLQWEVEKGETAARKTEQRRTTRREPGSDPRKALKAI